MCDLWDSSFDLWINFTDQQSTAVIFHVVVLQLTDIHLQQEHVTKISFT